MIQIHIAPAIHWDRAEVVLNWKERGTIESEIAQATKEWKAGGKTTQKSLPVEVYLQWLGQKKAAVTQAHIQVSSLSPTANLTHVHWKTSEVENVMVHAPHRLAYVVECAFCEGSLKQYYTRTLIISERPHRLQIFECADGTHSKSADLVIAPLTCFRSEQVGLKRGAHSHTLPPHHVL